MNGWTIDNLRQCSNCDNPRSLKLQKEGIGMCMACCFGEVDAYLEQLAENDVIDIETWRAKFKRRKR